MSKQTETLKLALEALKKAKQHIWLGDEKGIAANIQCTQTITVVEKALAQQEREPVANGKLKVTLQDTPTEIELAQYKRMLQAACADLGAINEALGLDPNDGGAEPILLAIEELRGRSQEPMAWMVYTLDGTSVCVTDNPSSFTPEHRALPLYTTPPPVPEAHKRKPLTDEQADSIINGLRTCLHLDSKRVFLKTWLRDWAAHGIKGDA